MKKLLSKVKKWLSNKEMSAHLRNNIFLLVLVYVLTFMFITGFLDLSRFLERKWEQKQLQMVQNHIQEHLKIKKETLEIERKRERRELHKKKSKGLK